MSVCVLFQTVIMLQPVLRLAQRNKACFRVHFLFAATSCASVRLQENDNRQPQGSRYDKERRIFWSVNGSRKLSKITRLQSFKAFLLCQKPRLISLIRPQTD